AWRLGHSEVTEARRWAWPFAGVAVWQIATGLGNVMLGWPLVTAVGHTAGAAVLAVLLAVLLMRARQARVGASAHRPAAMSAGATS
ncbi:MAG TPA: heme A synthase, partial [Caldimonas sp.]